MVNPRFDRNFQLENLAERRGRFSETSGRGGHFDFEGVLGIHREAVVERNPAGGIERQFFADALIARQTRTALGSRAGFLYRSKNVDNRLNLGVPDRKPGHCASLSHVAFDQNRGERKNIPDIVETITCVVQRQCVARFDVEGQQIANRV